ncbi:TIGR02444 family protein [Nitrincola sp. MINF-07-Sa-05]|uniref:TIGR02444 family protein n=1 Tax=Nitrincola salilacus TaxID=3400273 RepID=UPI0039186282
MSIYNPLWHYAITVYQRPGVEAQCLALQMQGLSVNRLLLCCWLAQTGRRLQPGQLAAAEHWQASILQPLRAIRYQVRSMREGEELSECYQQLKRAELAAEQVEIMQLWQCSSSGHASGVTGGAADGTAEDTEQEPLKLARQNINTYLAQLGQAPSTECLTEVERLLGLAFPATGCDDRPPEIDQNEL